MLRCVSKLSGVQDAPPEEMATVQGCNNSHCRDSQFGVLATAGPQLPMVPAPTTEKWLRGQNDRAGIAFGSAGEWSRAPLNLRPFLVLL